MGSFFLRLKIIMSYPAIAFNQVCKSYSDKRVLEDIKLEVSQGESYGLVGINGAGKSTMIKGLLDLVAINSGSIKICNKSHRDVNARSDLAYLPDRFSPPAHLRSKDFIEYMLELHDCKHSQEEINAMLDALELDRDTMESSVGRLSKGMTQKLGIASCLLSGKSILVLDEPMSGLDPKARVLFKKQLARLKQKGATLFFSSHVLADVEEIADTMAVLHQGKIEFEGTPESFKQAYTGSSLEEAYINCVA